MIRELGRRPGVALNPATPLHLIDEILPELDFVLLMTVNPGWGGQAFILSSRAKIRNLRDTIRARKLPVEIEVDGGVKLDNLKDLLDDGMEVVVTGSAVFEAADPAGVIRAMKDVAARASQGRP
jgi:ribulose-phosphate 3-epimerase